MNPTAKGQLRWRCPSMRNLGGHEHGNGNARRTPRHGEMPDAPSGLLCFCLQSFPFLGILKPEFDQTRKQFLLGNACGLMAIVLNHGRAAALNLARAKSRENNKTIFAVDVVGNKNQAEPPKDEMISSIRACCRDGTACPERTMDSRS